MKTNFLLLFIIISTLQSQSQVVTSSFNFGFQTKGIDFIDVNLGYICGHSTSRGYISKTANGGTSWSPVFNITDPSDLEFNFIKSLTTNNVVAIGEDIFFETPKIYLSTNAGSSWTEVSSSLSGYGLNDAYFSSSLIGYAVGKNGTVVKTTDSGVSWVNKPFPTQDDLTTTYFIDNITGFACSGSIIYKTTNGGDIWLADTIPGADIKDVVFFNALNGYLLSENGHICFTGNGGDDWYLGISTLFTNMLAMERNSSGSVIVSSFGNLGFKLAGSNHWERFSPAAPLAFTSFSFVNDTLCFSITDNSYFSKIILNHPDLYVPVVRFQTSNAATCLNIQQQFLNNSKPGYTYNWYVDNVFQTSAYNFSHTFSTTGSHSVRLTAVNPLNASVKDSITVNYTIPVPPILNPFNVSASTICEGSVPVISVSPSQSQAWYYIIDSLGNPVSSGQNGNGGQLNFNLNPITSTSGFTVVGRRATTCDTVILTQPITVNVIPLANINTPTSADRPFICDMDSTFINIHNSEPGISYRLKKNNILTSDSLQGTGGTIQLATHNMYFADAVYNVVARNSFGCIRQFPAININISKVSARYITTNQNLFVGDTLTLLDSLVVGDTLKWMFYPDASTYTDTIRNPIVSFTATGIKTALLTARTIHGCIDSLKKNIYVYNSAPAGTPTVCGATSLPIRSVRYSTLGKYSQVIDMTVDVSKNIYLTGYSVNEFPSLTNDFATAFILKCDSNMNILWEKKLFDPLTSYCKSVLASCILTDNNGSIYLGGKFFCDHLTIDTISMTCNDEGEVFVAKFSPGGIIQWIIRGEENSSGFLNNGGPSSLTIDNSGDVYFSLLYNASSIHLSFPDSDTLTVAYPNSASIIKIDPVTGGLLRHNSITSTSTSGAASSIVGEFQISNSVWQTWTSFPISPKIKYASNGLIYLIGQITQKQIIGSFIVDTLMSNNRTYFAAIADTTLNWINAFPLAGYETPNYWGGLDLAPVFDLDNSGNIYFSFRVERDDNNSPATPSAILNGNYTYTSGHFLTKFSSSGSLLWSNLNENPTISLRGLSYSNDKLCIAGNFRDFFGYVSNSGLSVGQKAIGGEDLVIAQVDANNGDMLWCRKYGSITGWEYSFNFFKSKSSNDNYVSGALRTSTNFSIEGFPIQNTMENIILAKFDPDTICAQLQVPNNIWHSSNLSETDNPNLSVSYENNQITIKFSLEESSTIFLSIYDILGNKIETLVTNRKLKVGDQEINYPSTLSSGIYLVKLEINNRQTVTRKVIVSY